MRSRSLMIAATLLLLPACAGAGEQESSSSPREGLTTPATGTAVESSKSGSCSSGAQSVEVPSLPANAYKSDAEELMRQAGLEAQALRGDYDGPVVATEPGAGVVVACGSLVLLVEPTD